MRARAIAEAQSLVKHQHARSPPGRFLVEGEIAAQIDRLVAVIDVVRLHRKVALLSKRWSPNFTSVLKPRNPDPAASPVRRAGFAAVALLPGKSGI
jgi:hypothetical protein